ncbi:MAG: hypothetical protein AAGF73_01230 [Actinomycetota bacterium]
MSGQDVSFAVSTYRYLRLSIVVVLVALLASVVFERFQVDCWQGSLGAYYYTPVQPIFVGALMAIAVVPAGVPIDQWRHQILVLETFELIPVGVFWAAQTVEYWDGDRRTASGAQRSLG